MYLLKAADAMHHEYMPFPTLDELLGNQITAVKDSLAEARRELLEEVSSFKNLIPDFTMEFESTVEDVRKEKLGSLPKIL
jgi:hypothetical protein